MTQAGAVWMQMIGISEALSWGHSEHDWHCSLTLFLTGDQSVLIDHSAFFTPQCLHSIQNVLYIHISRCILYCLINLNILCKTVTCCSEQVSPLLRYLSVDSKCTLHCEAVGAATCVTRCDTQRLMASWRPAVVIYNLQGHVSQQQHKLTHPQLRKWGPGLKKTPPNTHRY